MEHPLVIGILNIVEDKLREFDISIPDEVRDETTTDPIAGYTYAELHDRIMEFLEEQGVLDLYEHKSIHLEENRTDSSIKTANHAYLNASIPLSDIQFQNYETEIDVAKTTVDQLLGRFEDKYDLNSSEYQIAIRTIENLCLHKFPDLYDSIVCRADNDLIFSDTTGEYLLFYYNPDSVSGGQIVECYFNKEDAKRILNGESYIDVVAEHTQYLHDIDTEHFFHTVFNLIEAKNMGMYLGNDIHKTCQTILYGQEKAPASLNDLIQNAQQKTKTQFAGKPEKQTEKGDDSRE